MTVNYGIGDPGDPEAVADGGVIALLKRLRTILGGALIIAEPIDVEVNGNIGQQTMAASLPVVVASNQSALDIEIGGVAPQLDDTDKQAVSLYADGGVPGNTPVVSSAAGGIIVGQYGTAEALNDAYTTSPIIYTNHLGQKVRYPTFPSLFNGTLWDRQRNNAILALLASAARTATATSPTQTNYNWRGFVLSVDVTARAAATTLTPSLQIQATGGDWKTIWTAAAAINTANNSYVYLFYPGVIASGAALYVEELDLTFGRAWRVVITHNDANSITYSVGAEMIL